MLCQDPCTMDFTEIRYEAADGVLTITLNRPDRLNAFTPTMMNELIEAFDRADADDDVRAIIVTGEGRGFDAQEALEGGLVRSVHPPEELLGAAHALAREIADNTSAVSVACARRMLWRMLGAEHPMDAHRADSRAIYARGMSADAREG